jgi:hypothetical protein
VPRNLETERPASGWLMSPKKITISLAAANRGCFRSSLRPLRLVKLADARPTACGESAHFLFLIVLTDILGRRRQVGNRFCIPSCQKHLAVAGREASAALPAGALLRKNRYGWLLTVLGDAPPSRLDT